MASRIKRTERRGEFRARDAYGKWHTILVFQQIVDASTTRDRNAEMLGTKILQTEDGKPVYKVGDGVYEILAQPRRRVASDDPAAP